MTIQKATRKAKTATGTRKRKATRKATPKATRKPTQNTFEAVNPPSSDQSLNVSGNPTMASKDDQFYDKLSQRAVEEKAQFNSQNQEAPLSSPQANQQPFIEAESPVLIAVVSDVFLMVSKRILNLKKMDMKPLDDTQRNNFDNYVSRPIVKRFMPANLSGHPEITAAFATLAGISFTNVYKIPEELKQEDLKNADQERKSDNSDSGSEGLRENVPNQEASEGMPTALNI